MKFLQKACLKEMLKKTFLLLKFSENTEKNMELKNQKI